MGTLTDRNRQFVEEGLRKRAELRIQQERRHEEARRKMFVLIDANHEDACKLLAKAIEDAEKERAAHATIKAQEAARDRSRKQVRKFMDKLNRDVRRFYGVLAVLAVSYTLYSFGGIEPWVAIPIFAISAIAFVVLIIKIWRGLRKAEAIHQSTEWKDAEYERL